MKNLSTLRRKTPGKISRIQVPEKKVSKKARHNMITRLMTYVAKALNL